MRRQGMEDWKFIVLVAILTLIFVYELVSSGEMESRLEQVCDEIEVLQSDMGLMPVPVER